MLHLVHIRQLSLISPLYRTNFLWFFCNINGRLVVRTGSEPKPDPIELDLMVQFQVWGVPLDLTSKNQTEPDYSNTSQIDHGTQHASLGPTLNAQLTYQQHPYYSTEPQNFSNWASYDHTWLSNPIQSLQGFLLPSQGSCLHCNLPCISDLHQSWEL